MINKFKGTFDKYACVGDTITAEVDGFTVTARVEHDHDSQIDDTDMYPAEYDPEMFGPENVPENRANFEQALAARNAWLNDEWHYCGIVLSVSYRDVELTDHAAALWGIERNYPGSDNSYLTEVANELLDEALEEARKTLAKLKA